MAGIMLMATINEYFIAVVSEQMQKNKKLSPKNIHDRTQCRWVNNGLTALNLLLLVLTQFTGLYYNFDTGVYSRSPGYLVFIGLTLLEFLNIISVAVLNRAVLSRSQQVQAMSICLIPATAFIVQNSNYGSFILNVAVALMVMIFVIMTSADISRTVQRQQHELKDMRVNLMFTQIRPHFIFNSLTAIQSLIEEDPEKAYDAISDFSDFLRGVLKGTEENELVPATEDHRTARGFVRIQKMRYGDMLTTEAVLGDTNFYVPPLTIQPIVENAIKHGLRPAQRPGCVTLHIDAEPGGHLIEVRDNGIGFAPDALQRFDETNQDLADLSRRRDSANLSDHGRPHIGLGNVRMRIFDLCGGTMEVDSLPGRGTIVTMHFPDSGQPQYGTSKF